MGKDYDMNQLDRIHREYNAARKVIADALREWYGHERRPEARAEELIFRLSEHNPPILLEMEDDLE